MLKDEDKNESTIVYDCKCDQLNSKESGIKCMINIIVLRLYIYTKGRATLDAIRAIVLMRYS